MGRVVDAPIIKLDPGVTVPFPAPKLDCAVWPEREVGPESTVHERKVI
jgi:hypothetical protein